MEPKKIKLNSPVEEIDAEHPETAGSAVETTEPLGAAHESEAHSAEVNDEMTDEEMPILIPDDYDVEEIDYSARNTMSDVVAAKDNIQEMPRYERPKLKGKEALENFWYHNKTAVIVGLVATVMLILVIIQSIPTKFDYHVNIYADANFGVYSIEEINAQLMEYAEDVDETGEIKINTNRYNINSVADPYEPIVAYVVIEAEFSGDYNAFLVVVDKHHYDFIVENAGPDAFEAYEGYPDHISLRNSEFITSTAESNNNDTELFIALVGLPEKYRDDEEMVARYENAKAMLGRILADHPELAKAE